MCTDMRIRQAGQCGLTLIELLIFIVIVGIAATAILNVFGNLTRSSASLLPEKQAQAFAASKLAEIMAQPFANVAAYNGQIALTFPDTSLVASLPGYAMTIAVTNAAINSVPAAGPLIPAASRLLVTVTVTAPGGAVARVRGIRVN
jgi:MSHA pilin protein MshD